MKTYLQPRQSGKTTRCIEWLREDPKRRLLVAMQRDKDRLVASYPALRDQIVTVFDHRDILFRRSGTEYAVDDAERVLAQWLGSTPEFVTISSEEEEEILMPKTTFVINGKTLKC